MTNPYGRALARFWWLVAIGIGVAFIVAVVAYYKTDLHSWPPKFTSRASPTYAVSTNLLVDSPSDPYLRTLQENVVPGSAVVRPVRTTTGKSSTVTETPVQQPPSVTYQAPDTKTLVDAANLFPLLIQSDAVARLRERLYGPLSGQVTATAAFATKNTFGAYKTSPLPVVEISATARRPKAAKALAQATADAFKRWLTDKQRSGHIPVSQRITVEQLQRPTNPTMSGKGSKSLPLFLAALVVLAFGGLALLLDSLRPRRKPSLSTPDHEPSPEPDRASYGPVAARTAPAEAPDTAA
jgi:hypothetical protein